MTEAPSDTRAGAAQRIPGYFARRPARTIIAFATLIQLAMVAFVFRRTGGLDGFAFASVDAREYFQLARNLIEHGAFSMASEAPFSPDFWRVPGYPLFIAGLFALLPREPITPLIAHHLLSICNPLLLYWITRRRLGTGRAMLLSLAFACEPYRLFYANWLLATTLFTTILLACWLFASRLFEVNARSRPIVAAVLGLLCGLAVLVRPIALLIPLFLTLLALIPWIGGRPGGAQQTTGKQSPMPSAENGGRLRAALILAACCAMVVTPWLIRNRVLAGHWALSNQSGIVLAYFKATEVVLWNEGRSALRFRETSLNPDRMEEPHEVWDRIDDKLRARMQDVPEESREALTWPILAQGNRAPVDSFRVSRELSVIAWKLLWEEPLGTVGCTFSRMVSLLTFPLVLGWGGFATQGNVTQLLLGGIYLAVSVAAGVQVIRRLRSGDRTVLIPVAIVAALLLATTPQLDPRFRVPVMPMLLYLSFLGRGRESSSRFERGAETDDLTERSGTTVGP